MLIYISSKENSVKHAASLSFTNKKNHLCNTSTVNTSNTNTQSSMMSIHLQRGFKLSSPSCSNTAKRWPSAKPEATGRPGPPSSAAWVDWGYGLGGFEWCILFLGGGHGEERICLIWFLLGFVFWILFGSRFWGEVQRFFCRCLPMATTIRHDIGPPPRQDPKRWHLGTWGRFGIGWGNVLFLGGGKLNRLNPSLLGNGNCPHQNGRNMTSNEIHIFLWSYELTFVYFCGEWSLQSATTVTLSSNALFKSTEHTSKTTELTKRKTSSKRHQLFSTWKTHPCGICIK